MSEKAEKALRFYLLAAQLKDRIRSGWDDEHWNISKERRESIAEHIYGACILAIAIDSEYKTDVNIEKVIMMLVLHELGEVEIGDITPYDGISLAEKTKIEQAAIERMLKGLVKEKEYCDLLLEFNERKTKEAVFAYHCDKLEANIQAKIYQDAGHQHPLDDQEGNVVIKDKHVQQMIKEGAETVFDIWYGATKSLFEDDDNFADLLDCLKETNTRTIDSR
ncbi:HD domain-containing protein [Candidatus Saccharibacteria bacterium]|nr:HD domain-containing protein [Candidatus Saccharibacteria bacterium]